MALRLRLPRKLQLKRPLPFPNARARVSLGSAIRNFRAKRGNPDKIRKAKMRLKTALSTAETRQGLLKNELPSADRQVKKATAKVNAELDYVDTGSMGKTRQSTRTHVKLAKETVAVLRREKLIRNQINSLESSINWARELLKN